MLNGEPDPDHGGAYVVNLADEPYRCAIQSADLGGDTLLAFDGFGAPDADGVIVVRSGSRRLAINIDAVTGEITVEEITAPLVTALQAKGLNITME